MYPPLSQPMSSPSESLQVLKMEMESRQRRTLAGSLCVALMPPMAHLLLPWPADAFPSRHRTLSPPDARYMAVGVPTLPAPITTAS
ncbi:MAG: hypothetical protein AO394_00560 [Candidatus Fermentibacter daniensis]|nr:MAG: hypothetical protein AO394_00560 [Candidatus Fermentibacter daniensis]